jgi:hypothetical protein
MRVGRDGFLHVTVFMQKRGHAIMASHHQTRAVAFGRRPRVCTIPVGASLLANGPNTIPLTNPKSGLH